MVVWFNAAALFIEYRDKYSNRKEIRRGQLASGRVDPGMEPPIPGNLGRGLPLPYPSPWPGAGELLAGQLALYTF